MSLRRKRIFRVLIALGFLSIIGCGVKGDPLPPERPAELGRGRPTYRRATEGLKIEPSKNKDQKNGDEKN